MSRIILHIDSSHVQIKSIDDNHKHLTFPAIVFFHEGILNTANEAKQISERMSKSATRVVQSGKIVDWRGYEALVEFAVDSIGIDPHECNTLPK